MRNLTQREIARRLKVSTGIVCKVLAEAKTLSAGSTGTKLAKDAQDARRASKPRPALHRSLPPAMLPEATQPDDEHTRLRREYSRADSPEDIRAAAIALHRFENPDFAECLDRGLSLHQALAEADNVALDLLCDPAGVAYLAQWQEEEPGDAVALLEGALRLLHARSN